MLIDDLKSLLQSHGLWAKKSLGQNFLADEGAFDQIMGAAKLQSTDTVVEVGPGTGFLTERLLAKAERVIAVEYDAEMVRLLKLRFLHSKNLELMHQDALRFSVPRGAYKVVANIPYYITSPLLKHFLQSENRPSMMVILVQKEVAEKICGLDGKSMVTIETQLFGRPEIVELVPRTSFYPAPKVDSAILKIEVYPEPLVQTEKLTAFLRLVGFGFTQKRKKLSNALAAGFHRKVDEMRAILETVGLDSNIRAEELEIGGWLKLLTKINF
ncbi:MAG: 16S rRNA (adenine(1518)-N(6)/adenine(1519)-N(6))-dimethyltransferase RsmA [Candidatus Peregrinibacteria bacterium]